MSVEFGTYRTSEIAYNLKNSPVRPFDIMLIGVTGAGKSTTLNALFQRTVAKVGTGPYPETVEPTPYELNEYFRIWDTPGLGDSVDKDRVHKQKISNLLRNSYCSNGSYYALIDMVVVVLECNSRDLEMPNFILNKVLLPNISKDRILVVINRADIAMSGRHWNDKKT